MPNEPKTSHYLGVDYGKSHIGLSIADSETRIAFGYGTLENTNDLCDKIAGIIQKEDVSVVVIGMPELKNRESKENQEEYKKFGEKMKEILPEIKIEYANEMFSTKIAQANLIEKGMRNVKDLDHMEAARIILQSWLEHK